MQNIYKYNKEINYDNSNLFLDIKDSKMDYISYKDINNNKTYRKLENINKDINKFINNWKSDIKIMKLIRNEKCCCIDRGYNINRDSYIQKRYQEEILRYYYIDNNCMKIIYDYMGPVGDFKDKCNHCLFHKKYKKKT